MPVFIRWDSNPRWFCTSIVRLMFVDTTQKKVPPPKIRWGHNMEVQFPTVLAVLGKNIMSLLERGLVGGKGMPSSSVLT